MSLSPSIPRFVDLPAFKADPLSFLRTAHNLRGNLAVISEDEAIFSDAHPCAGVVAVFGVPAIRQIMTDPDVFGMPVSKEKRFSLPPLLQRLNAGLFSMTGEQHRSRQQLLLRLLGCQSSHDHCDAIVSGWIAFREEVRSNQDVALLSEMRRLMLNISGRVILGDAGLGLGRLIQSYFDDRRKFSGVNPGAGLPTRRELVRTGVRLDGMLRARLAELRAGPQPDSNGQECVFAQLSKLEISPGQLLTDDELVAHGNLLFLANSVQTAVVLTWTLLILSQRPDLRRAIRRELRTAFADGKIPQYFSETELPFLNGVIKETLRLLPPNAIMVRLTTRVGQILGHHVPESCEVVLSPYVAQRDAQTYPEPDTFDPGRWRDFNPSAYSYFPFGVGNRSCLAKELASFTIRAVLVRMLNEYDVFLSLDQSIDWKIDFTLMPSNDPVVRFVPVTASDKVCLGGRLSGPVSALMQGIAA